MPVTSTRYRWILFDADGTLFDFDTAERAAVAATFSDFDQPYEDGYAAIYSAVNRLTWAEFERGEIDQKTLRTRRFERLFAEIGVAADPRPYSERFLVNLADNSDLLAGAEELLRELHGKVNMLIITNGLAEVQRRRLSRSTIEHYFEHVIISEEVGSAKPDSGIFDHAFARMGSPDKRDGLIVGDSLTSDIRGGCNYGIDTCWFNPSGRARPGEANDLDIRHEITHLDEVARIVYEI